MGGPRPFVLTEVAARLGGQDYDTPSALSHNIHIECETQTAHLKS